MDLGLALLISLIMGAIGLALGLAVGRSARPPPPAAAPTDRRLETLGALAAGIVHEVAQPLSAARVSIEGLHYLRQLGREPAPGQVAKTLDRVGMSLLTMTQILDHLRYLAGAGARALLPLRLEDAAAALVADRASWLHFGEVELTTVLAEPTLVQADPTGLRLVLANLARNAAEAVARLPADRRWVRLCVGPGPTITVEDPGLGLPPEVVARLFQPFISTRGEARGVGLSLARAAAERMGGTLIYLPRPDGGTLFRLTLQPAAPAAAAEPHP